MMGGIEEGMRKERRKVERERREEEQMRVSGRGGRGLEEEEKSIV